MLIEDNILYHTVGSMVDIEGSGNQLIDNLLIHSVAEATFRVSEDRDGCIASILGECTFEVLCCHLGMGESP